MMAFSYRPLPEHTRDLRREVRAFLDEELAGYPPEKRAESWDGFDRDFSRKVGARGWIGMTWPRRYGGHERSALERYVVIEEMLAAGAPVSAHWFADRQSGPLLLRFGSEAQRHAILPRIARGELCFAVGLSEPDVGSDMASVRARARRVAEGWRLSGTKLWTTNAHRADYMIGLFRTAPASEERHAGLSQFLIDMTTPGITVRPIEDLAGRRHFNEVVFDDVALPDSAIVGAEGDGWAQVTAELAYERSGPERYLSSIELLIQMIARAPAGAEAEARIGAAVAGMATLRQMSCAVAGMLQDGQTPLLEAAIVKDLGTALEQAMPEMVHALGIEGDPGGTDLERVHAAMLRTAPCFSLRGGTREVMRGIIARGLGLR